MLMASATEVLRHSPFRQHRTKDKHEIDKMTLTMAVEMPDSFSPELKSMLVGLLQRDVNKRLGCRGQGANELKNHPFFRGIDWRVVYLQRLPPPLIPARGEVNAADAFDIGSFDEEDTKHINLTDADQELYRNFPVVVSERWQHEIAETIFDYINHEADKAEMKRKNKNKLGYQEEEWSDCILHGYVKRLGGTFTATWLTRYLRLYPNRLELYSDSGKPELIFMDQIEEVCNEYVQIKNEQCIVIKMYNHSKYVFTNSDEIGLKEWHVSLKAAHKESLDMLTTMAEKATKIYGAEIPLKHLGKRRQQLQLEANSAVANLEQKLIQEQLTSSQQKKQQQQQQQQVDSAHGSSASTTTASPSISTGTTDAKALHGDRLTQTTGSSVTSTTSSSHHKHHRHQHRGHHHRTHHHSASPSASKLASKTPVKMSDQSGVVVGGGGDASQSQAISGRQSSTSIHHRHHRSATGSRQHSNNQSASAATGPAPSQIPGSSCVTVSAKLDSLATSSASGTTSPTPTPTPIPTITLNSTSTSATSTTNSTTNSTTVMATVTITTPATTAATNQDQSIDANNQQPVAQEPTSDKRETIKSASPPRDGLDKCETPQQTDQLVSTTATGATVTTTATATTTTTTSASIDNINRSNDIMNTNEEDARKTSKTSSTKVTTSDQSSSSSSSCSSTSSSTASEKDATIKSPMVIVDTPATSKSSKEQHQQQQGTNEFGLALPLQSSSGSKNSNDNDNDSINEKQKIKLAVSLENLVEVSQQEVMIDPSKRITSNNYQRERDLVTQYEKLNISAHKSPSTEEITKDE